MSNIDRAVRRAPLKPLVRRSWSVADRKALLAALERLDGRALGEGVLQQLREVVSSGRDHKKSRTWDDPAEVTKSVALVQALYVSRRISTHEYVFFAGWRVEGFCDARVLNDPELQSISQAMEDIERRHHLSKDEFWPRGEGPEDYLRLNDQFENVCDSRFLDALKEFGLDDLADLKERHPEEFDRLRERGRRSVFHRSEHAPAIRDVVLRYEEDAKRAAGAKAYSAAVTLLGAGVESI